MTKHQIEREQKLIELAIRWRDAKYSVEEAILQRDFWRTVDMIKKDRRDEHARKPNKSRASVDS